MIRSKLTHIRTITFKRTTTHRLIRILTNTRMPILLNTIVRTAEV